MNISGSIQNRIIIEGNGTGFIDVSGDLPLCRVFGHWGAMPSGSNPNYSSSTIAIGGSVTTLEITGDYIGSLTAGSASVVDVTGGFYDSIAGITSDGVISIAGAIETLFVGLPILGGMGGNHLDFMADSILFEAFFDGDYSSGAILLRDGLPESSSISVGGDFDADAVIQLNFSSADPNDVGLAGQVHINVNNGGSSWLGDVIVGSITLPLPDELDYTSYYTQLSSELGGGAVGHAPFNFHQRETAPSTGESMDCNPYQNEERALALSEKLDYVEISHYGPVYADGTGPHFRVEFLPDMDVNPVWVDRTSMFEIDSDAAIPNPTGTDDGSASRVVTIKAVSGNKEAFKAAGTWRIRPIPGKVKCGSVVGNPNVRYTSSVVSGDLGSIGIFSWYQFRVLMELQPGVFALDSGNGTQASDLAEWILSPYETNADGETNTQDFIDMADQYTGN